MSWYRSLFGGVSDVSLLEITVWRPLLPCLAPLTCRARQLRLTVPFCLADCLLHEENFSVRCPKHKVSPRPRAPVLPAGRGVAGALLPKGLWTLEDQGHHTRPRAAPSSCPGRVEGGLVLEGGLWHGDQHPVWYWELQKVCCRETCC